MCVMLNEWMCTGGIWYCCTSETWYGYPDFSYILESIQVVCPGSSQNKLDLNNGNSYFI